MDLSKIAILDTETTGLDRNLHEVWEVAYDIDGDETILHFPVDLTKADPGALKMNGFHERYPIAEMRPLLNAGGEVDLTHLIRANYDNAKTLADDLRGKHILGAVPNFDDNFLWKLLRRYGLIESWHYHLMDIENLIIGYMMGKQNYFDMNVALPWKSNDLSRSLGVEPEDYNRHSAIGDVRWCKAQLMAMLSDA